MRSHHDPQVAWVAGDDRLPPDAALPPTPAKPEGPGAARQQLVRAVRSVLDGIGRVVLVVELPNSDRPGSHEPACETRRTPPTRLWSRRIARSPWRVRCGCAGCASPRWWRGRAGGWRCRRRQDRPVCRRGRWPTGRARRPRCRRPGGQGAGTIVAVPAGIGCPRGGVAGHRSGRTAQERSPCS